jgi:hypothetical protein
MKNKRPYRIMILFFVLTLGLAFSTGMVSSFSQVASSSNGEEITLIKTVGLWPNHCSATNEIAVPVGTKVFYCYQINTGAHGITRYTLADDKLGILYTGYVYQQPNILIEQYVPVTIFTDTLNTATLTATNSIHPNPSPLITTDIAIVTTWIPVAMIYLPVIVR